MFVGLAWQIVALTVRTPFSPPQLDEPFNLETYAVPLREWVEQDQTRNEIRRRFVSAAAGAGRCELPLTCIAVRATAAAPSLGHRAP